MGRRVIVLVALTALLTLSPSIASEAQVETGSDAVTAEKTGWWNSLQGIESGTPAAPIGGVYPGFPQQATGVPVGDFASALRAGELDKVGAIGILIDAPPGAVVEEFTMTLTESLDPGATNSGQAIAKITACPIVAYWVEAENARFNGRPEADCNLAAAPGVRNLETGKWTFDLKAYGQALLATGSTLGQNGVLLMPIGAAPETYQVTWAGPTSDTPPTFTFRATGGEVVEDEFAGGGFGSVGSTDSGFGSDFSATTFDDVRTDSFDTGSSGGDLSAAQETPAPAAEAPEASAPPSGNSALGREIGNIAGNLPPFTLPAFLLLLVLMGAVGIALGRPLAQEQVLNRRGGVSRALAARRATTKTTLEAT